MNHTILNTQEAAELLGVGASTIKRWADEGRLAHFRTAGGHRRFRQRDVERFATAFAKTDDASGHEGPEARGGGGTPEGNTNPLETWLQLLLASDDLYQVAARLLHDCARLGAWWRVAAEVGDLLRHIGRSWQQGAISIVEEHVATERLVRALTWCVRTIPLPERAPVCLLLTAEGDEHTVGLTLVELCAREAGWSALWAGRGTPLTSLEDFLEKHPVAMMAVSASSVSSDADALHAQAQALTAATRTRGIGLVLGGEGAWPETLAYGHRLRTFDALHLLLTRGRP